MGLESIGRGAEELLKSKTLGGVSKESAMAAINKVKAQAMEAIGKVQEELNALKGKSAQEIAELTSKNDRLNLQLKNVKNARSSEKTLANGNKIIRKVNSNGAVMEKQLNSDNQLIRLEVTPLNGTKRRTTYNPVTGKPVKTYTDTTGEEILIKYDEKGKAVSKQKVNNKKECKPQPRIIDSSTDQFGTLQRTYSDGTQEIISTNARGVTFITRKRKSGLPISQQLESKKGVFKVENKDKITSASIKFKENMEYKEASIKLDSSSFGVNIIDAETKTLKGTTYKLKKLTNKFGQDAHSFMLTKTTPGGNTSFEEIPESKIIGYWQESLKDSHIKIGDAIFFKPDAMRDIIDRW